MLICNRRALILSMAGTVMLILVASMRTAAAVRETPTGGPGSGSTVALVAIKDNTLYEDATGSLSNGAGQYMYAGQTWIQAGNRVRRGLIAFDIAGNIPPQSLIISVTLQLYLSKSPPLPPASPEPFSIHRVLTDWGEGSSDALEPGGDGAPAADGDATWVHAVYSSATPADSVFWKMPGGDFQAGASATTNVMADEPSSYTWGTTPAMVADVWYWLNNPDDNHGWLLMGNEDKEKSARRFNSSENIDPATRPTLYVTYKAPSNWNYLPSIAR